MPLEEPVPVVGAVAAGVVVGVTVVVGAGGGAVVLTGAYEVPGAG